MFSGCPGVFLEGDPFFSPLLSSQFLVHEVCACFPMLIFWRDGGAVFVMVFPKRRLLEWHYLIFLRCAVFLPIPFFPSCVLCAQSSQFSLSSCISKDPDGKWESCLFRWGDREPLLWLGYVLGGQYVHRSIVSPG